jgi:hypothetical protein
MTEKQIMGHKVNCQKAVELTRQLHEVWKEVRDFCVLQENRTDVDQTTWGNELNDEVYRPMYEPYAMLVGIDKMLAETGTGDWLADCTE